MSCIIFGYRRFYAIICKITHFFYPKRKNPPLFAHSTLHKAKQGKKCALLRVTRTRSVRISASGGDDDRRRAFPPPRQAVAAVRNPVFRHAGSW